MATKKSPATKKNPENPRSSPEGGQLPNKQRQVTRLPGWHRRLGSNLLEGLQ
jgi:hypothetical protein